MLRKDEVIWLNPEQVVSVGRLPTGFYLVKMSNNNEWRLTYDEMMNFGLISNFNTNSSLKSQLSEKMRAADKR